MVNAIARKRIRKRASRAMQVVDTGGQIVRASRESRITRLKARAVRDNWGLTDTKLKVLVADLLDSAPKSSVRDKASIASALSSLMSRGIDESKFELEKIKVEDGPKSGGTTVNVGVGVNVQQQYEERVAGRDYDELCAEIAAEAASVTKRLEAR